MTDAQYMNGLRKSLKRHFGRVFVREYKDGHGFQMLVFGCFWMSVSEGNFSHMETKVDKYGGLECFDDCSVLWNDITTVGMLKS